MLNELSDTDRQRYMEINDENLTFLRSRYNKVNRWVIADMVRRSAYRYPEKPALIFGDSAMTYTRLEEVSNQFARALLDHGLKKYDRVAVLAHNTLHHVVAWLGTAKAGGIYLAINYLLRGKDISYCIKHSESKVFVVEDALYPLVQDVMSDLDNVNHLIWSGQGRGETAPDGFIDFDAWFESYPRTEPGIELHIEDPVQMTYTSGTETLPKGVILTNQALLSEYTGCIIDGQYSPDDINLNVMPIFHCAQRDVFLNPCLMLGAVNVLLLQPDPVQIITAIEKYRATMFFAAPTVWIAMLRHPGFDSHDLGSLKKGYYGASIMPVEVLRELLRRMPNCQSFYNYYGQTELSPYHTMLKPAFQLTKPGSAGQGGLNMETRLEDDLHRPVTEPGKPGEICGRGPHAMLMYFKEPEKTEAVLAHGWFHSGDIGVLDEDNFISVADRKKDMVKTGGENVPSREVEEVIYLHPAVSEVAVIGLPHDKWVEAVTAVVTLKQGRSATEDEILTLCRQHLAPFKVPKGIIFTAALPKTPSGKILKRDMRQHYREFYVD
ncbi:acyl-CoA synthetase [Desulfotomaculum copahuensis]|uniref:Acyl-CoA synthetase n=1 Tax=Desulfotomaculum copahuensis TaxID=1838280 RepID=A0A1B7LI33_9FIRM|nr:acyl-CoA synthetase [Desulfotomaculum copahuensis]OAT85918.1 acyl-CoA synthetase [Desulfotomaculum copahuensis]